MPVIQSARLALDKGELDLKSAKGQLYPKISLSASYGTFYSSPTFAPDGSVYPFFEQFRDCSKNGYTLPSGAKVEEL